MHVITKKRLKQFWERHPNTAGPLKAWFEHASRAEWRTPNDLRRDYGDDVILPDNRAVFKIKGNAYRLVVRIHYNTQTVFVRFIGTHSEYDKIDATKI